MGLDFRDIKWNKNYLQENTQTIYNKRETHHLVSNLIKIICAIVSLKKQRDHVENERKHMSYL